MSRESLQLVAGYLRTGQERTAETAEEPPNDTRKFMPTEPSAPSNGNRSRPPLRGEAADATQLA